MPRSLSLPEPTRIFRQLPRFELQPAGSNAFQGDVDTLYDFADDFIKPEFERVPGIAVSNIFGGRPQEIHVVVDPSRLAARQVTMNQLGAALERENRNYSGGDFTEGKRRYMVARWGNTNHHRISRVSWLQSAMPSPSTFVTWHGWN